MAPEHDTPLNAEHLRALCDAATEGPWVLRGNVIERVPEDATVPMHTPALRIQLHGHRQNAGFVVAARSAVPLLLDELEALRDALSDLRAAARALLVAERAWSGHFDLRMDETARADGERVLRDDLADAFAALKDALAVRGEEV